MSVQSNPCVSVIIPVFNDSKSLKICLEALENQTYSKSLYEVIVVDNGSDESIEGVVSQFGQVVAAYESRPGSYAARNKGISLAKGEIIAFTDADCIPASDWIEKGVANLLSVPNCGLLAGKVEMTFRNPNQPTAVELVDSTNFLQKSFVEKSNYGITANVFTFKSVIDDVGCFDDSLKSCGDRDWGRRIFAAGYRQIYADDTCVAHPARYSYGQLYKRYTRVVGGDYDLMRKNGYSSLALVRNAAKNLKPPLKTIIFVLLGKNMWSLPDKSFDGIIKKLKFIFVFFWVKYVSAWENIRLLLGGKSKRS